MNVALVGAGQIAAVHLACLRTIPAVRVVGVCDRSAATAAAIAERFGIGYSTTDITALLASKRPDVVHVTTPVASHAALAEEALDAGADVLVEKPAASSYREVVALLDRARTVGRLLAEDYNYLYDPAIRRILELVSSGEAGPIRHLDISLNLDLMAPGGGYADRNAPHPAWSRPGGPATEFITHMAALVDLFAGPHDTVHAVWEQRYSGANPCCELTALIGAARGTATVCFSASTRPDHFAVRVTAADMQMTADLFGGRLYVARTRQVPRPLAAVLNDLELGSAALRGAFARFARALRGGPGTYEGLWELVRRLYASLAAGTPPPVTMEQVERVNRLVFAMLATAPPPPGELVR